jgi:uncharacterized repeat protein (TIGR01451 family)
VAPGLAWCCKRALVGLLFLFIITPSVVDAAEPGEQIPNFAHLTYEIAGTPSNTDSNTVYVTVRSEATIRFMKFAPTTPTVEDLPVAITSYDSGGGSFINIPQPAPTLQPTVPLVGTPIYYLGEDIYLWLEDKDQNLNDAVREQILLTVTCAETGDTEVLRLTETGLDTGVFTGYLPSAEGTPAGADGSLSITEECHLEASYTDALDLIQTVVAAALVDPYGIVFDTTTGEPVDGATIRLLDAVTGNPTLVYGDDGVSIYQPDGSATGTATIITGGTATDESGKSYQMPPGGFRFPYVLPGQYRLEIAPPEGYSAPTLLSNDQILVVRPDAALEQGSRGEVFTVDPGPALRIDIPVDPSTTDLWLRKDVDKDSASVGDFVRYRLTLENTGLTLATNVAIEDRLPLGFRYQSGSARQDNIPMQNPAISVDGRTLTFQIGDLAAGSTIEVSYVVEISSGAKLGAAINQAVATGDNDVTSNVARVKIDVEDVFFRNATFLAGRVMQGSCDMQDTEKPGLQGVRVYLEDGSYSVTDKDGKYHFEGVDPGVHVVQVDLDTIASGYEMIPCEETSQFAGRTFSQFVDLQGGTLWRADFYAAEVAPPTGEVTLQLFSELDGETATYTAVVSTESVSADNLRITFMLPSEAQYIKGSARVEETSLPDPAAFGGAMTLMVPDLEAGSSQSISLKADIDLASASAELPAKALLTFDTEAAKNQRTPIADVSFSLSGTTQSEGGEIQLYPHFQSFVADLQKTDIVMLEQLVEQLTSAKVIRVDVVGHTDNDPIAKRSQHIFADNLALSEARASSVARYLQEHLDIASELITLRGVGDSMPIADNASESGKALNRRVELNILTAGEAGQATLNVTKGTSDVQRVTTSGADLPRITAEQKSPVVMGIPEPPQVTSKWLSKLKAGTKIVWPTEGYSPINPSTAIMVQHPNSSQVQVTVNGEPVPRLNYDTKKPLPSGMESLSLWDGVDLTSGRNLIEARITGGNQDLRLQREIWYISDIQQARFIEDKSVLFADGLTNPVVVMQLTDKDGNPARPGMRLDYRVSSPYQALEDTLEGDDRISGTGSLTTGANGMAAATLQPTTQSGEVTIKLMTLEDMSISTWLKPAPRDWILVGFAEGTIGYNTFSGNQVSLEEAGIDEHFYDDGQVKFFAKGAIKGEWLLTMAYDSDKPNRDGDTLHQIIDPDSYYPLYGDGTRQGYEAASARDLYVKIERDQFYALFGDMETGLTQTELSRYARTMNGIKSEMQGERFSYTLFAAETGQAFAKDEIRGDGTSGRYHLSTDDLVVNSEEVVIEVRDRFHSERILETRTLSRHRDYDIDYDAGSLFFKEPIPSKDENLNPVFIVVRYETEEATDQNLNYGGRAAVKLLDKKVEVGASYIHEERGTGKGDLYGADATIRLTGKTTLNLEAATTDTEFYNEEKNADAYRAEVEHDGDRLKSMAYYREQQEGFGLGQQNGSETGTRKYGAEGTYDISKTLQLTGQAYHEDNLSTNAERDVAEFDARYKAESYSLRTGIREARDNFRNGEEQRSTQWLAGADWLTLNRKLRLRADYEQALNGKDENSDFPTLLTFGADYRLTETVSVFAEQEFSWGEKQNSEGTRAGIKTTPWSGADIITTIEREFNENGERVNAIFGLTQNWQMNDRWNFDFSIDRSQTVKKPGNDRFNSNVPPAHGSDDDFTALSVGATYRQEKWTWWNRLETRQADNKDKYGASTSVVVEPKDGVAVSAKALAFITKSSGGVRKTDGNIRLGMAYRPSGSRWIVLNRFDFYFENEDHSADEYNNWRIVNNMHANFRLSRRAQVSFYYGLKYVRDTYNGVTYSGFTDLISVEARYNINSRWDIGAHASILHSWNSNSFDYSLGADVGYSPMTNTWVSLGYNLVGFEDKNFSVANYTAQGAYLRFRAKFDQQSVRDAAEWINQ